MSRIDRTVAASTTFQIAGAAFTTVIELGTPHISADGQDELPAVVFVETLWRAGGVTFDWRNTNAYFSARRVVIPKKHSKMGHQKESCVSEWRGAIQHVRAQTGLSTLISYTLYIMTRKGLSLFNTSTGECVIV